ncbi:hypothetical protein Tco_0991992 [Tanacetum coccineum]|uniref:Uncharacterized protein n=1 Tax=Tanacetum coccineum TaxID=301880 RepID=A0ABQ5F0X5_9ASTR
MNFITLFGSIMGTLDNGGRVSTKLLKRITEDVDISDIDWCGYILDCLHTIKIFKDDQMMIDLCKQYEELFNDNEFNLYESSKENDSEGEPDGDNENNNHDDDGAPTTDANKKKESENQKKERKKKRLINKEKKVEVKEPKKVEMKELKKMEVKQQKEEVMERRKT